MGIGAAIMLSCLIPWKEDQKSMVPFTQTYELSADQEIDQSTARKHSMSS